MFMYKLELNIFTDGDCSCLDYNHENESVETLFLVDDFEQGLQVMEQYLKDIVSSLSGRDNVVHDIKKALNHVIVTVKKNRCANKDSLIYDIYNDILLVDKDLGDQSILISLEEFSETVAYGARKLTANCVRDWD